jgi:hypothetical protein
MTIIRESAGQRDGLFGFLVAAFALALVRGVMGASTSTGRIVVAVVFGALTVVGFVAWMLRRRRAPWLEISDTAIELARPGSAPRARFDRAAGGALRFVVVGSWRARSLALQQVGSDTRLGLQFFNRAAVETACIAHGWSFD